MLIVKWCSLFSVYDLFEIALRKIPSSSYVNPEVRSFNVKIRSIHQMNAYRRSTLTAFLIITNRMSFSPHLVVSKRECIDRCIWSLETAPINSLNFPRLCALLMLFFDLVVADPCTKICDANCAGRGVCGLLLQFHLGNCGNIYACYVTIVYFFQTARITKWAFGFFYGFIVERTKIRSFTVVFIS